MCMSRVADSGSDLSGMTQWYICIYLEQSGILANEIRVKTDMYIGNQARS